MQATANRLLGKYQQGTAALIRAEISTPGNPWSPVQSAPTQYPLTVVVEPIAKKYIDDKVIFSDDRMVLFQVLDIEPVLTDRIMLGSKTFEIKKLFRYPDAGMACYHAAVICA
jgi:hypothetical protein